MYYTNSFFIYSILGFCLESIIYLILKSPGNSGILYGPWTPVYGIGAILIILISKIIFDKLKYNQIIKSIILFFTVSIVLSFIEWLGGTLIEQIFNITYWDYSDLKYHIGKYISLEMAAVWGLMAIIFIYFIKPLVDKIITKIPKWITYFLTILMVIDFCATIFIKINIK